MLGKNRVGIVDISIHKKPVFSRKQKIYFLTPVTVYTTLFSKSGKKKTYYYSPFESEFAELITKNLFKKYEAFYKKHPRGSFSIKPAGGLREKILKYKNFIIKGWIGKFEIKGTPKLLYFAYDAGLGAKNSQGFGMFEVVK